MNMHVEAYCSNMGMIQTVNRVDITGFDWPEDFTPADYDATSSTPGCLVDAIEYIRYGRVEPDYEASAGDGVRVRFTIELADGYIYGDPSAYVGDVQNNACLQVSNNERIKEFLFNYTVPTPAGGLYVREIRETIAEPVAGTHPAFQTESMMASAKPSSTAAFAKPTFYRHYTIDQVIWLEHVEDGVRLMLPNDVFKHGCGYALVLLVSPDAGYQFSPYTAAKINDDIERSEFVMDVREWSEGFLDVDGSAVTWGVLVDGLPTAIDHPVIEREATAVKGWYSLDGRQLGAKPTQKGIYVKDGRKVIVR
jgi:hypothetical protein